MRFGANVAEDFIAARMMHGAKLVDLTAVFAFADGRVIVSELANLAVVNDIQTRVTDMTDGDVAIHDYGYRENTPHALPFRLCLSESVNFVVSNGDGFAD